jgi:hypothetical protein
MQLIGYPMRLEYFGAIFPNPAAFLAPAVFRISLRAYYFLRPRAVYSVGARVVSYIFPLKNVYLTRVALSSLLATYV